MTPELARELLAIEARRSPDLVVLARHVSLAARVELELLRAMRLRALPGSEPGLEADLYFSALVQSRGVDTFTLLPAVRTLLQEELSRHREELERARTVLEEAHAQLDAVILLEERATYHTLRGDHDGALAMQRELGSVIRELRAPTPDPGLVRWAARVWPRLPDRLRRSQAGRVLNQVTQAGLRRLEPAPSPTPTQMSAEAWPDAAATLEVGFTRPRSGVLLTLPPAPGALTVRLPGRHTVRAEIDWPTPGGWETRPVELSPASPEVFVPGVPLGLIVLRADNGDEFRFRPEGVFGAARPRLEVVSGGFNTVPSPPVSAELEELDWDWAPPSTATRPRIFLSAAHEPTPGRPVQEWERRLHDAGFDVWRPEESLLPVEGWPASIQQAMDRCDAAVVLLTRGQTARPWQVDEIAALLRRQDSHPRFIILPVLWGDEAPPADAHGEPAAGIHDIRRLLRRQVIDYAPLPRQADEVIKTLVQAGLMPPPPSPPTDALLVEFDHPTDLERSLHTAGPQVKGFDPQAAPMPPAFAAALASATVPRLVRIGAWLHQLAVSDDPEPATEKSVAVPQPPWSRVLAALQAAVAQANPDLLELTPATEPAFRTALRTALLQVEHDAIQARPAPRKPSPPPRQPSENPVHAMVFIQYPRWRPRGDRAEPQSFDSYRSSQHRLVDLVGDEGTLWVVTRAPDTPGRRPRYQLAYRLRGTRSVRPRAQDQRVGKDHVVRASSPAGVTHFPPHDATDLLLSLEFATGDRLTQPSQIGQRLRSIPQLTVEDVQKLEAFTERLPTAESSEPASATFD